MVIDEEKLSRRIRQQHNRYINSLTSSFDHCIQRVIKEISYGLLAKQSALLSEIARSLNEPHDLPVTINRLSENLSRKDFYQELEGRYMRSIKDCILADSIIVVDDGDISKPRSRKLEGLAFIWDGSEHEKELGYPLFVSVAVTKGRENVVPILLRLFSREEDTFISDNVIIDDFLISITKICGTVPVYVFDRGFCSLERQKTMENMGVSYVMRAMERHVQLESGVDVDLFPWASEKSLPYSTKIISIRNGKEVVQTAWFRVESIRIECLSIRCIIMQIEGHGICILFTNRSVGTLKLADFGEEIICIYGHRWSIEEYNRFKKQIFDFENMRVQSLRAMKNYVAIMTVTTGIISNIGFFRKSLARMTEKLISLGKPLRPEVRFPHYRLAAGIKALFEHRQKQAFTFARRHLPEPSPLPLLDNAKDKA